MEEHFKKVILRKWFPNGVTEKITVWNLHFFKVFTGICGSMKILSIFVMYGTFQLHKRFYRGKRFFRLLKHSFKNWSLKGYLGFSFLWKAPFGTFNFKSVKKLIIIWYWPLLPKYDTENKTCLSYDAFHRRLSVFAGTSLSMKIYVTFYHFCANTLKNLPSQSSLTAVMPLWTHSPALSRTITITIGWKQWWMKRERGAGSEGRPVTCRSESSDHASQRVCRDVRTRVYTACACTNLNKELPQHWFPGEIWTFFSCYKCVCV